MPARFASALALPTAFAISLATPAAAQDAAILDQLYGIADEANSELPLVLDATTRLETAGVLNGKMLYSYTLFVDNKSQYKGAQFRKRFSMFIKAKTLTQLCQAAEMEFYRSNNIALVYSYYFSDGDHIVTIKIEPSECPS